MKPITTYLSLQLSSMLRLYFTKMENDLTHLTPDEQLWVGAKFFPAAVKAVSIPTSTLSGDLKEAFYPFWQLALSTYIRTAEKSNKKIDQKLVFLALDSGGYCDGLQSQ
jgi:hypothetical protein